MLAACTSINGGGTTLTPQQGKYSSCGLPSATAWNAAWIGPKKQGAFGDDRMEALLTQHTPKDAWSVTLGYFSHQMSDGITAGYRTSKSEIPKR